MWQSATTGIEAGVRRMPQTDIILLERVKNLGNMGDVVRVKPGYARNYLLPQGKALRATKQNRDQFEAEKAARVAASEARRGEAEALASRMKNLSVVLIRAASESGQLYGSASSRDIAAAVTEAGFAINRNQVDMERAIKTLGLFPISIAIHPEVMAEVTVNVARSRDEAVKQLQLGRAIVGDDAEADAAKADKPKAADAKDKAKDEGKKKPRAAKPDRKPVADKPDKAAAAKATKPAKPAQPAKADATGKKPAVAKKPAVKKVAAKKPVAKKAPAKKPAEKKGLVARLFGR